MPTFVCEICNSENTAEKRISHKILGSSQLVLCKECGHKNFIPAIDELKVDKNFSSAYVKVNQHDVMLSKQFSNRRYFIDYSRLMLLQHFTFLDDGMSILELGPGYPGLFQQMKLSGRQLNLYAVEASSNSRELLQNYGVECIGEYYPLTESVSNNWSDYFDVIIACNILYYFNKPIEALQQMLDQLREGGVILIDIINNEILDESYLYENTMAHIFSKRSLELAINAAGGTLKYINTNCVKEPGKAFEDFRLDIDRPTVIHKLVNKILNQLGMTLVRQMNIMKYFAGATQMKYTHPEGQYIRAIVTKN